MDEQILSRCAALAAQLLAPDGAVFAALVPDAQQSAQSAAWEEIGRTLLWQAPQFDVQRSGFSPGAAQAAPFEFGAGQQENAAAPPAVTMEEISRFFQQDARRY